MKKTIIFLLSFLLVIMFATIAFADDAIPNLLETIENVVQNNDYISTFLGKAKIIFGALAAMYFVWNAFDSIVQYHNNPAEVLVFALFRTLLCIALFHFFVTKSWSYIISPLGDFFSQILGSTANISTLSTKIIKIAAKPYSIIINYFTNGHFTNFDGKILSIKGILSVLKNIGEVLLLPITLLALELMADICMVIMLFAGIKIIIVAVIAKVDLYFTEVFAVLALGFWGAPYTRDIAMTALRGVVSSAIRLTVTYMLGGVFLQVADSLIVMSSKNTADALDCIYLMFQYVIAMFVLASLFETLPNKIASIFSGIGGSGFVAPPGSGAAQSAVQSAAMTAGKATIGV